MAGCKSGAGNVPAQDGILIACNVKQKNVLLLLMQMLPGCLSRTAWPFVVLLDQGCYGTNTGS